MPAGDGALPGPTTRLDALLPDEDPQGFIDLQQAIIRELDLEAGAPDPLARRMALHLAATMWRRERAIGLETVAVRALASAPLDDEITRAAERRLALLIRYQGLLGRDLARELAWLRQRPAGGKAAPRPLAKGVAAAKEPEASPRKAAGPVALPWMELPWLAPEHAYDYDARRRARQAWEAARRGPAAIQESSLLLPPDILAGLAATEAPAAEAPVRGEAAGGFSSVPAQEGPTEIAKAGGSERLPSAAIVPATMPSPPSATRLPPPPPETLEQQADRLLARPVPMVASDVPLADALTAILWQRPHLFPPDLDRWRLDRHLTRLRRDGQLPHPDRITELATPAFAAAAAALPDTARRPDQPRPGLKPAGPTHAEGR